jgi:hypothetical protein
MLVMSLTLVSQPATALKPSVGRMVNPRFHQAPECSERPEFISETRTEIVGGFAALPKAVLVARDAEMWVEGREDAKHLKVHAYQSFLQAKSRKQGKVLCGTLPEDFADRFSLMAPTLIDASLGQKVGNSMWQFQVIADRKAFSVWNKKSIATGKSEKLDQLFKDQQTPYRLYQIGHNEFELVVKKDVGLVSQTLSVRFEAMR